MNLSMSLHSPPLDSWDSLAELGLCSFFFPPPTHGNKKVVYLMFKGHTEINPMKNVTEFVVMII